MRYPAAEKLEIIRLVEQSHLPVRRTLDKLAILPARFYRWYDRYQSGGYEALKDRPPRAPPGDRVWRGAREDEWRMSLTIGWEGMSYKISSRDYLCRARERLASANAEALFYATFELRAGVEARMSEYVEVQRHVSKKLKRGWQIAVLGKGIDRAFKLGDKLARFSYREGVGGDEVFVLYYTPVSKALQRNAQQLGDYLHHQKRFRPDDDEWWVIFRRKLETTLELLHRSCTGTMLGPPLMGEHKGGSDIRRGRGGVSSGCYRATFRLAATLWEISAIPTSFLHSLRTTHTFGSPKLISSETFEPHRVWRSLQLLRKWSHYERDKEQVFF